MLFGKFTTFEWFLLVQHELLLFAAVFFVIGAVDELVVDLAWIWLRVTGRASTLRVDEAALPRASLSGRAAIFIPVWQESAVIGSTLTHALAAWPHSQAVFYIGGYRNDPETIAAVATASGGDARVRLVINAADGPTSKADCLNRLYAALCEDEARSGEAAHMVLMHDAEDMVDPAALPLLDQATLRHDFVQLPVIALPQRASRWIGTHYSDEFAEAHGKTLVVRGALGAAIPGAGVGSAIARPMLTRLADMSPEGVPFARQSLTEDYELGLRIAALGGRGRFLRARTTDGRLIATRAFFPSDLVSAVRQKTRWMHGIALQSWDRLGWTGSLVQLWMQLRDRRGPFAALLLTISYALVLMVGGATLAATLGLAEVPPLSPTMHVLLLFNFAAFGWRLAMRMLFTARNYGLSIGLLAAPRMVVSNVIAIMAGRRAVAAYLRTLRGAPVVWDKTEHRAHPMLLIAEGRA